MTEGMSGRGTFSAVCTIAMLLSACSSLAAAAGETSIAINEVMASNGATKADPQGQFDDWIELYNYGQAAVDVGGMYLTDDPNEPQKWQIPTGNATLTTIAAQRYLLIWADGNTTDQGLHAGFKLDAGGERVALFASDGTTLIDLASFPELTRDISYGRYPDANEAWQYFGTPTPGAANKAGYLGLIEDVRFSQGHGFCSQPVTVTLTTETPDATIYYTTNGDVPGQTAGRVLTGTIYSAPLTLSKTTCLRAIAIRQGWKPSAVTTATYIFVADVVKQSPSGSKPGTGWPDPVAGGGGFWGGGGTQVIDYGMDPDVVNNARYKDLVDDALLAIPTISLVTPLASLFDKATGIYVNALQDGVEWERPVSMELIYPDGAEGFQIDAGLRIRGGYGRQSDNAKHSFRLFFRGDYGQAELHYPLFGDEGVDTFEKVDLRCEQNYSWAFKGSMGDDNGGKNTLLRDIVSRDIQGVTGKPYARSRYYHLYLDGQYWGIYQTEERPEARYAASYLGGISDDYDTVKVDAGPNRPYTMATTDGTIDAYYRLWDLAVKGFGANAAYYRAQGLNPDGTRNPTYERLLDVDNVIDYMICTYYAGDIDAPISNFLQNVKPNNFYALYNRTNPDGFKFIRHDAEHTMFNVNENRLGPYSCGQQKEYFNPQYLHQQLMSNAEYKMRFADRVYEHFFNDGAMTPATVTRLLSARRDTIDLAIIAESARWGDAKVAKARTKDDDWLPQVKILINDYIPKRTDIVLAQFKTKAWYPAVNAPTFNQHGGSVGAGFSLEMTASMGDIYYTLDGTDPRLPGGAISPTATKYAGPVILNQSVRVRARVFLNAWSAMHDATFAVGPVAGSLRISEIMYHPADTGNPNDPNTEYIELTNIGAATINLSLVRFINGVEFTFGSTQLAPGGYCVVVKDLAAFQAKYGDGLPVAGQYVGSLANNGERIELVDAVGTTIHNFAYDDAWYDTTDGDGYSLTIVNAADPDPATWSQPAAWRASSKKNGSPGATDNP